MGSETAADEMTDGMTDGTMSMTKSDGKTTESGMTQNEEANGMTASKKTDETANKTTESSMTQNEEANGTTVSPRFSGSSKVMTLKRGSSQTGKHGPMKVRA